MVNSEWFYYRLFTIVDGGKAKRLLSWEPKVGLEEGLRRTIEWYRGCLRP